VQTAPAPHSPQAEQKPAPPATAKAAEPAAEAKDTQQAKAAEPAAAAAAPQAQAADPAPSQPQAEVNAPAAEQAAAPSEADVAENTDVASQLKEARKQLKAKHPDAAEALLRQMLERSPNDSQTTALLTQALIAQRQGAEAVSYAEQLVKQRPKRAVSHLLLGDARNLKGDRAGALAAWRDALALDPNSREAKRRLDVEDAPAPAPAE
jgi:tetratricopeptide (TPR) repeat protein